MNQQFLVEGILCREVFRDVGTDHEERGGCYELPEGEVTECQDCQHKKACPADGEEE